MGLRFTDQTGIGFVIEPQRKRRVVTSIDLSGNLAVGVPAGYELHVKVEAKESKKKRPAKGTKK